MMMVWLDVRRRYENCQNRLPHLIEGNLSTVDVELRQGDAFALYCSSERKIQTFFNGSRGMATSICSTGRNILGHRLLLYRISRHRNLIHEVTRANINMPAWITRILAHLPTDRELMEVFSLSP